MKIQFNQSLRYVLRLNRSTSVLQRVFCLNVCICRKSVSFCNDAGFDLVQAVEMDYGKCSCTSRTGGCDRAAIIYEYWKMNERIRGRGYYGHIIL